MGSNATNSPSRETPSNRVVRAPGSPPAREQDEPVGLTSTPRGNNEESTNDRWDNRDGRGEGGAED